MTIGVGHVRDPRGNGSGQNQSIWLAVVNVLHRLLVLCVRFIVVKVHGERGPSVQPITNLIQLESATSLAQKIRSKNVMCIRVPNLSELLHIFFFAVCCCRIRI